jgi:hypothetical protein
MEKIKHEWYSLAPTQRLQLVLDLLDNGYTTDMLNEYFDVKTKRVINDFMNSKGYKKKNNTYVLKQEITHLTDTSKTQNIKQQYNVLPNIQIDEETIINILNLSKRASVFQEIADLYEKGKSVEFLTNAALNASKDISKDALQGEYIEVIDTTMPIEKLEGEIKRTTIRINEHVMDEFNNLWREKYFKYKQHDLLAIALKDFIKKYK